MKPMLYTKQTTDKNIGERFVKSIQKSIEWIWSSEVKQMIMTEEDKIDFDNITKLTVLNSA